MSQTITPPDDEDEPTYGNDVFVTKAIIYCSICERLLPHTLDQGEWLCDNYEDH